MPVDSQGNWDPTGEAEGKSRQEGSERARHGEKAVTQEMHTSTRGAQLTAFLIMIITGVDSAPDNALKLRSAALHTCY